MKCTLSHLISCGLISISLLTATGCAFQSVSRSKNITYLEADQASEKEKQELNIFAPRKHKDLKEVFIFLHGGNWNSGKKSLYSFLGNRLAKKDIVAVIIDYPLSPKANYKEMAIASAKSVAWVQKNIERYGGDPNKIFISGHSAGGHLASLISLEDEYFKKVGIENPIKGTILIDAAGLDMYGYLKNEKFSKDHTYIKTFTSDQAQWKEATPLYHLYEGMPPMLIYRGGKTYPSIEKSNEKFVKELKSFISQPNYQIQKRKKHIPMITQFFWTRNPLYRDIIEFMGEHK